MFLWRWRGDWLARLEVLGKRAFGSATPRVDVPLGCLRVWLARLGEEDIQGWLTF